MGGAVGAGSGGGTFTGGPVDKEGVRTGALLLAALVDRQAALLGGEASRKALRFLG